MNEDRNMTKKEPNMSEPNYYIALVLKGSEGQYLDLLKYIDRDNGAAVIYQRKSLTFLSMTRDDGVRFIVAEPDPVLIVSHKRMLMREQRSSRFIVAEPDPVLIVSHKRMLMREQRSSRFIVAEPDPVLIVSHKRMLMREQRSSRFIVAEPDLVLATEHQSSEKP